MEEFLDIRFYSPDYIQIPSKDSIMIPDLDEKELPAFKYRIVTSLSLMDSDFAVTQKANLDPFLEKQHGGKLLSVTGHMTHTFYQLVESKRYYKSHPEYFALSDGVRIGNVGQFCLTNENVLKIATESVLKWFEEDPQFKVRGLFKMIVQVIVNVKIAESVEQRNLDHIRVC